MNNLVNKSGDLVKDLVNDTISRAAALDALTCKFRITGKENAETVATVIDEFNNKIKALPSAQPEIMRCKDCRYNNDCEIQYSAQSGDEFFCGCAERKDNG